MILELHRLVRKITLAGVAASAAAILFSPAVQAQNDDEAIEEVMVTGFRESLEAALNNKRNAANNMDSIVAEDIGKMPDLNLAESLQRVPGVAINREGGEGRNITVRGLRPDFTRTTLNGMEVPASAGGLDSSGGVNRSRGLDFNIFASELFNRIDIHKSPRASIEEGGLASTVDLHTAKPFDNPGFHVSAGVQMTLDNLADENDPRIVALISNTFLDDTLGVLLSVAQSERTVRQEGFGTVRWASPFANGGRSWADTSGTVVTGGTPDPTANHPDDFDPITDDPLDFMFTPRLPRMDFFGNTQDRTGITAAIQFRPNDRLELGLDLVQSKLENDRISYNYFGQFRNVFNNITPLSLTLDPSGRYVVAGSFDGVEQRSESRGQFSTTDFRQVVASGTYDFTDNTTLSFMLGNANAKHDEEQYRYNLNANPSTFSFDFSANPNIAEMTYGFDILDISQYAFVGPFIRKDIVDRDNDTLRLDLDIQGGSSSVRTGIIFNNRTVNSQRFNPTPGTFGSNPAVTAELTDELQNQISGFGGSIGAPAGFPRNWLIADFAATTAAYGYGDFTLAPVDGTTFQIEEKITGAYIELDVEADLLGKPLRINSGVRVVQTETTGSGSVADAANPGSFNPIMQASTYSDVLPSTNIVWELQDDLLLRLNAARNMSRPGLASLSPTITSVSPLNGTISRGNPSLDPMRADSAELGIEWYFDVESLLAFTYFQKDIDSDIVGDTVVGTLSPELQAVVLASRPEYDPASPSFDPNVTPITSSDWQVTQPVNGPGARVSGYEIAYQQPFTFLPGIWSGLGVVANYTHIDSELVGVSENSYNFALYYETDAWGARVAMNERDDFITNIPGGDGNAEAGTTGPSRVDVSAYYDVTDFLKITLEVINLTEEEERLFVTGPLGNRSAGDLNLVREYNTTGREVYLGARVNF